MVPDFERSQEVESRMIRESPYATPPNIHEASEFDTPDATELQSKDNEVNSAANPKSALKRRLADVTSLGEVADSHSATPFFWHVPKVSQSNLCVLFSHKMFLLLYRSSILTYYEFHTVCLGRGYRNSKSLLVHGLDFGQRSWGQPQVIGA